MSPYTNPDWAAEVGNAINQICDQRSVLVREMAEANAGMVRRVFYGQGPDNNQRNPAHGARVAVNIAAVHVPAFCKAVGKAYKNAYDLGKTPSALRTRVDSVLSQITDPHAESLYFGAVEINGSGMRFYGDMCFILKPEKTNPEKTDSGKFIDKTVVLDSNSYDLVRPPITPAGTDPGGIDLVKEAQKKAGLWATDTPNMAVLKTMAVRNIAERRLTTGQISDAVLNDEDYLEVLMVSSFNAGDLEEVRTFAADAAAQAHIGEQLRLGPCPMLAELQWRKHRLAAVRALDGKGVRSRVVTTSGRVR